MKHFANLHEPRSNCRSCPPNAEAWSRPDLAQMTVMRSGSAVLRQSSGMRGLLDILRTESVDGGRHWTRTSDLLHVKQVL